MNELRYANAVARIRANELSLVSKQSMEQVMRSKDITSALKALADKGYAGIAETENYETVLKARLDDAWQLLNEVLPEKNILDFLVVKNDFHNIKNALKCIIAGRNPQRHYMTPSVIPPKAIDEAVKTRNYSELPKFAANTIAEVYEVLSRTQNGQEADIITDRRSLEYMLEIADKTGESMIIDIAQKLCALTDIKIALRGTRTKKDRLFFSMAIAKCSAFDKQKLINSALTGENALKEYLMQTDYREATEHIENSNLAFEKWCDDLIMKTVEIAKSKVFGVEPLIAYYIAKEAEVKNIRIMLSCINNGISAEETEERMRLLYV